MSPYPSRPSVPNENGVIPANCSVGSVDRLPRESNLPPDSYITYAGCYCSASIRVNYGRDRHWDIGIFKLHSVAHLLRSWHDDRVPPARRGCRDRVQSRFRCVLRLLSKQHFPNSLYIISTCDMISQVSVCLSVVCLHVYVCLYVCLFMSVCPVCQSVCFFYLLPIVSSACLYVSLFVFVPICLYVCLSVYSFISNCLHFVCLSLCPLDSLCMCVCLFVRFSLSFRLSVYPYLCLFLRLHVSLCISLSPSAKFTRIIII